MNFVIVVVMYNRDWTQSETLCALLNARLENCNCRLFLWDNSPRSTLNPEFLRELERLVGPTSYTHTPENLSLAAIYNKVADGIDPRSMLVLLDQDTALPPDYFVEIARAANDHPESDVILPTVRSAGTIVSPGSYFLVKGRHWRTPRHGLLASRGVVAISSGMAIRGAYLNEYKPAFDERLTFYGIDTKFMLDYAKRRRQVYVLELCIPHDSALESKPPARQMLPRFRNMRRAWFTIHRHAPLKQALVIAYSSYVSLKLALAYRDVRFLY